MKRQYIAFAAVASLLSVPLIIKMTRSEAAQVVEIDKTGYRNVRTSILASGVSLYEEQVLLSPELIGKVSGVYVREGQQVKHGDLLLHLDDRSYRAEVDQREAAVRRQRIAIDQQQLNVANQRKQLSRKLELHKLKFVADAQMEDASHDLDLAEITLLRSRADLEEAEAVWKQAKESFAKTIIRAPISGTVTTLNIKIGETAVSSLGGAAGSNLMTIANTATMITEVNVDEADIAKVATGQAVAIFLAAYPDVAINGEVLTIPLAPKQPAAAQQQGGASQARSYSVKVKLIDTKGLGLRPGMSCRAEIFTASSGRSLAVPLAAVFSNNDENTDTVAGKRAGKNARRAATENYVFVDQDGKAEKRVVTIGASDDSYQEVRTGIAAGDVVITGPYRVLRHLKAGDRIEHRSAGTVATLEKSKS